jgi:hypothetical protein
MEVTEKFVVEVLVIFVVVAEVVTVVVVVTVVIVKGTLEVFDGCENEGGWDVCDAKCF